MNFLIIEDDKKIRNFLRSSLRDEGFIIDIAEDGKSGLQQAESKKYDLIILDNCLPLKSGFQVCSELRSKGHDVPIIILSVESESAAKTDILNAGADDYMSKPFYFTELLARIRALLRRPKKIEENVLQFDDITLNPNSHVVIFKQKEIHLTLKEFTLLEYLMRNRGRVLSRKEILEHVWDINADPFTNTIETHILNIRKKIQNNKDFIHTIPGVGYKVD